MKAKRAMIIPLCLFLLVFVACVKSEGRNSSTDIQFQTDTEPIYNHFPGFPNTESMEWYSDSDEGIGLSTTDLYVFAYFDDTAEIDAFLETASLSDTVGEIDAGYIPETVAEDESWQQVLDLPFAFQDGVSKTDLMNTDVYINSEHTIIYMHAIGE